MTSISPVSSTVTDSTAAAGGTGLGGAFAAVLGAIDTLQQVPGLGMIVRAAAGGALGGPAGIAAAIGLSVVGELVHSALTPSASGAGTQSDAGITTAAADPAPAAAPALPASAAGGTAGNHDLALRTLAALAAYDRTAQHGKVAPGQILA